MRQRRSEEQMLAEPSPVMYEARQIALSDGIRSSFPDWRGSKPFDWRGGWTRLGNFFADGYFLRDEMRDLVHNRFGVKL